MRGFSKMLVISVCAVGIIAFTVIAHILWTLHRFDKTAKPYGSYTRLVNLASGFDDYKKQNGVWPADITQLVEVRPDLGNNTNDAYGNAVVLIPYSERAGYGEVISYGRDGKPGGDNQFDRDLVIRFPMEVEMNAQWNKQIADQFKSRASRGLP